MKTTSESEPRARLDRRHIAARRRGVAVLGGLASFVAWLSTPTNVRADDPPTSASANADGIRVGAGSKGGGFAKLGDALVGALGEDGRTAEVVYTGGSCENVRKLARGEVDVGLVQYDVAAEAFAAAAATKDLATGDQDVAGQGGWMCDLSGAELRGVELQLVTALEDSAVHVLVKRPVRLDDLTQLGERPIFAGQVGSGSMETSKVILGAAGLTLGDVNSIDFKNKAAMEAMERGELLLMLRTTEVGDDGIAHLLATGMASLNALPESVMERLIDGFPYYRVCQIDAHTYPGLEFGVPTVCVSSVLLTARRDGMDALSDAEVKALHSSLNRLARTKTEGVPNLNLRWRDFAEREPVPLHPTSASLERWEVGMFWLKALGGAALSLFGLGALRNALRRRGLLGNPLTGNLEGQLSNPVVPFAGFLVIVGAATLVVWNLEHDSNARVRTLNDSFWEMNMFATGNFNSDSLKTSTARVIGAAATIAGLGLLAWFTAALTSILSRDQMRLFRSLRNHVVILNFREDMLQLIRVLRSPGPLRQRAIHVVISDALPPRVRLQLMRVRGLTIYQQNPEAPEDLVDLRLPRAARVIVMQGASSEGTDYHPLRIARAVQHACVRFDPLARPNAMTRAELGLAPSVQSPSLAGDDPARRAAVPVTLVEVDATDEEALFEPFSRWLIPVPARRYADAWLARACLEPAFGEFFNDVVTFREGNSELYTVPLPEPFHGKTWRDVRRRLYMATEGRAGIVPVGLYRGPGDELAGTERDLQVSSPRDELRKRLLVNPRLDLLVQAGDRVLAFAEDEADLRKVLGLRRFG